MFTSSSVKPNLHRSSNLETIDRLVQALDKAAHLAEDAEAQDSLDTLTSSLKAAYATFGIFDSLTLARGEMSTRDSDDYYDGIFDSLTLARGEMSPNNSEDKDDLDSEDDFEEVEDDDGNEADSACREFDSSWEHVVKATRSCMRPVSTRRSGVRRGHQEAEDSTKVMFVPTKLHDGNHKSDSRLHVSINKNRVVPKQSTPPAAAA